MLRRTQGLVSDEDGEQLRGRLSLCGVSGSGHSLSLRLRVTSDEDMLLTEEEKQRPRSDPERELGAYFPPVEPALAGALACSEALPPRCLPRIPLSPLSRTLPPAWSPTREERDPASSGEPCIPFIVFGTFFVCFVFITRRLLTLRVWGGNTSHVKVLHLVCPPASCRVGRGLVGSQLPRTGFLQIWRVSGHTSSLSKGSCGLGPWAHKFPKFRRLQ